MNDYRMHTLANVCLRGLEGASAAQSLCEKIKMGFKDYTFRAYSHEQLLQSIFHFQPRIALNVFFGSGPQTDGSDLDVDDFDGPSDRRKNPLDGVPADEMLRWCDEEPDVRYSAISRAVSYHAAPKDGKAEWTALAIEMLKRAPNPVTVLETFVGRFSPTSWSGSRAAIVESRVGLLDSVDRLGNTSLSNCVMRIRPKLMDSIAQDRKWETERDSDRDERFE
jgi:hypothetical protein